MAVFRVERTGDYTVMSNFHLKDKRLSLKAKGLLSQMLSLPDDWDYTLSGLSYINRESKDAIRSAVNELETAGYIRRRQTTDASGKFAANEYTIFERPIEGEPMLDKPLSENPITVNPSAVNPLPENPTQLNTKKSNARIVKLVYKFLKAGYLEDWVYHKTYSGTPQGGILSPLLANIYLHELDKFVMQLKDEFDTPEKGKITPEYRELHNRIKNLCYHIDRKNGVERESMIAECKTLRKQLLKTPCTAQTDKKLKYIRYADDFIIGVKGSKEDCQWIKSKLSEFIGQTLKMELSEEKTLITHSSECARFLGFDVRVRRCEKVKRNKKGTKARTLNNHVELLVPFDDKIHNFIFSKGIAIQKKDGKLFPVHRNSLLRLTDLEIVTVYNNELRGICNYYGIASNFCKLKYLSYLMEYSCLKTLAAKHKSKISKVVAMYKDGTGEWGIPYETKKKAKRRYFANYMDCKDAKISTDCISNAAIIYGQSVTPLEKRLKARICELCGTTESERYEIHHINKLKNLKGKEPWEIAMLAKRRKTLVVCEHCHHLIHNQ